MRTWDLRESLSRDQYAQVLHFCAHRAATFGFVMRPGEKNLSRAAQDLLADLSVHLVRREHSREWPGVRLHPRTTPYLRLDYRIYPGAVARLLDASGSFDDWACPQMPENLFFIRKDGTVLLSSLACEGAWVDLTDVDQSSWVKEAGLLASASPR